jgi:hypothetical protein
MYDKNMDDGHAIHLMVERYRSMSKSMINSDTPDSQN